MPFVQIPDLTVHYESAGGGENVLVLVHGNFGSWRWWRPALDRLPVGFTAYAPDLRGCGDTDRPPPSGGYAIEQLASDLRGFVDALQLPPFHLIGHSLGGAAALQFALDHPDRARTLTLVAPAPAEGMPLFRATGTSSVLSLFDLRDASLAALDTLYRFWRGLDANRPILRRALMRVTPTLDHDDAFEALVDDAAHMAPEAVVGYLRSLDAWNVQTRLAEIAMPVLIVWGERDVLVRRAALERTARGLRLGRLETWPDVGHPPQLEQPDRFIRLLLEFIHEHSSTWNSGSRAWLRALWNRLRFDRRHAVSL